MDNDFPENDSVWSREHRQQNELTEAPVEQSSGIILLRFQICCRFGIE